MRVNGVHDTLRARVRAEADKNGLMLDELAAASAIPATRLQAIFEGKATDITLRELAGLSLALNVPVAILLTPL